MPNVYDNSGRLLGEVVAGSKYPLPASLGSALWEFLHPEQVQQEYVDLGKTPPTKAEIFTGSLSVIASTITPAAAGTNAALSVAGLAENVVTAAADAGITVARDTAEAIAQEIVVFKERAADIGASIGKYALLGVAVWVAVEVIRAQGRRRA